MLPPPVERTAAAASRDCGASSVGRCAEAPSAPSAPGCTASPESTGSPGDRADAPAPCPAAWPESPTTAGAGAASTDRCCCCCCCSSSSSPIRGSASLPAEGLEVGSTGASCSAVPSGAPAWLPCSLPALSSGPPLLSPAALAAPRCPGARPTCCSSSASARASGSSNGTDSCTGSCPSSCARAGSRSCIGEGDARRASANAAPSSSPSPGQLCGVRTGSSGAGVGDTAGWSYDPSSSAANATGCPWP
mmetsp:Transcript_4104/g.17210  ORF Transcript_4104/g.17210 Transcript_4104/m.17210 type:complete len:248 (+) Transcript_4104:2014-2757(+)